MKAHEKEGIVGTEICEILGPGEIGDRSQAKCKCSK